MSTRLPVALALTGLLLFGCYPRELISWCPDGRKALVVGEKTLHVCDIDGELSEPLLENVTAVAWAPDGEHFVTAVEHADVGWDDVAGSLPDECRSALEDFGDRIAPDLTRYRDDPERLRPKLQAICRRPDVELLTLLYLRDHHQDALKEALPEDAPEPLEISGSELLLCRLSDGKQLERVRRLDFSLLRHRALEVGPDGELLGCVVDGRGMLVAPLDGGDPAYALADRLLPTLAWSSDGGAVFAVDRIEGNGVARLLKAEVRDVAGEPALPARVEGQVALLTSHPAVRVQTVGDDLLISSGRLELPAPARRSTRLLLYRVVPGEDDVIDDSSKIEPVELPEIINTVRTFSASADGRYVMVVGDSAAVLLDLKTGQEHIVTQERTGYRGDVTVIPGWRGNEDVWLIRQDRLYRVRTDGSMRELEVDWPADILPPLDLEQ